MKMRTPAGRLITLPFGARLLVCIWETTFLSRIGLVFVRMGFELGFLAIASQRADSSVTAFGTPALSGMLDTIPGNRSVRFICLTVPALLGMSDRLR